MGTSGSELKDSPFLFVFVHLASAPGDMECYVKHDNTKDVVLKFKGAWHEKTHNPNPQKFQFLNSR